MISPLWKSYYICEQWLYNGFAQRTLIRILLILNAITIKKKKNIYFLFYFTFIFYNLKTYEVVNRNIL
jgi:hypothetical protein